MTENYRPTTPQPLYVCSSYNESHVRAIHYHQYACIRNAHAQACRMAGPEPESDCIPNGNCVYGPSSKTASSLACCVVCCMTTRCRKIHEFILLPQAKVYPSRVDNFIFYQKWAYLCHILLAWSGSQFLATVVEGYGPGTLPACMEQ